MVECECVWTIGYGHTGKGFNRYMVECECRLDISMVLCVRVLIDTWWNVNLKIRVLRQSPEQF